MRIETVPAAAEAKEYPGLRIGSQSVADANGTIVARGNDIIWNLKVAAAE